MKNLMFLCSSVMDPAEDYEGTKGRDQRIRGEDDLARHPEYRAM